MKKRTCKRIMSLLLAVVMVLGMITPGIAVEAANADSYTTVLEDDFEDYELGAFSEVGEGKKYSSAVEQSKLSVVSNTQAGTESTNKLMKFEGTTCPRLLLLDKNWENTEMTFDFKYEGTLSGDQGIYVSSYYQSLTGVAEATSENGYIYVLRPGLGKITAQKMISSWPEGEDADIAMNANILYHVKAQTSSDSMAIKVWADGETEPENWTVTKTVTGLSNGGGFYMAVLPGSGKVYVDNMEIKTVGENTATVFADDFETYTEGQVTGDNNKSSYTLIEGTAVVENTGIYITEESNSDNEPENKILKFAGDALSRLMTDANWTDTEMTFDFKYEGTLSGDQGLYVSNYYESLSPEKGYIYVLRPGNAQQIGLQLNAGFPYTDGFTKEMTSDTWYHVKLKTDTESMAIKIWAAGEAEPEEWLATRSVTGLTNGGGLHFAWYPAESGATGYVDNLVTKEKASDEDQGGGETGETAVADLEALSQVTGWVFESTAKPTVVQSEENRVNVLKYTGAENGYMTVPSDAKEKRVTFDFKCANATSWAGLYFDLCGGGFGAGPGGSMMPGFDLKTAIRVPTQSFGNGEVGQNAWYSCTAEIDETSVRFKVYPAGTSEPQQWTMEALLADGYLANVSNHNVTLGMGHGASANEALEVYIDDITVEALEKETVVDTLDQMTGLEFHATNKPELVQLKSENRANVLKFQNTADNQWVTVSSEKAEKRLSFDFKYENAANTWGGLYFDLCRTANVGSGEWSAGLGGALMPAFDNQNLMLNLYQPSLLAPQPAAPYTMTSDTWYSCIMELDGTTIKLKVYPAGSEVPTEWTMSSAINESYFTAASGYDAILGLAHGATKNDLAIYIDNIILETLESGENEEITIDPPYTYFYDDFDSYGVGEVVKKEMPAKYTSFDAGKFQVVEVEGRGNVLQGDAGNPTTFAVDCSIIDKEVSFDFLYNGTIESYGGLYVKMLLKQAGVNEQYFSINPGFDNNNLIVTDTTNSAVNQEYTQKSFVENTWYSVKSRMVNQKIHVKIWPASESEPAEWTSICNMGAPVTDNTNALFWMQLVDLNESTPVTMQFDNFCIKTWDELQAKTEYTITVNVNDPSMGSVTGDGVYLEGNTATLKAIPVSGYKLENWTDEDGVAVSTTEKYEFKVDKNRTLTANFGKVVPEVKSFMADGMTLPAEIDTDTKTVTVTFASDVDLSQVRPYFYFADAYGEEKQPYDVMNLSDGNEELGYGWTVVAKQNRVMLNLYVDGTNGSDSNTGRTPKEAFATIGKAKEAVRALETWSGDVLVNIADGEYVLTETLEFDSRDSAGNGCSVIYRSLSGNAEDVVISSGVELKGWTKSNDVNGAWEIDASEIPYSRDLYVNGEKAVIARTSENESIQPEGWSDINDPDMDIQSYGYIAKGNKGNLHTWKNHSDIEFVYEEAWTYCVIPVTKIEDNGNGTSKVTMHEEAFKLGRTKAGRQIDDPNYIQNAFELLDEEGEWYFDRTAKKIYYIPVGGANPNEQNVVIPTLDQLITVNGTGTDTVDGLAFKDLTFEYTSFIRPHTMGQVEIQANFVVDPATGTKIDHDNFLKTPGGITVAYATGMRVAGCTFSNFSASGLDFEEGVAGSTIVGNEFKDIGASGIQVGGASVRDAQPFSNVTYENGVLNENAGADPNRVTEQILVMSNKLENIGAEYNGSIGIFVGYVRDITLAHNDINNTPYSAISAGWGWGYWDEGGRVSSQYSYYHKFDTPTVMERYVIENNKISKVCQRLADGGSIYTLSLMPGSIIRGNVMDDCKVQFGGLYLDEGSGGFIAIEDNIATSTVHTPYFYHLVAGYTDRQADAAAAMKNNYFKTRSAGDATYEEIWNNAGLLSLAADRTFAVAADDAIVGGTVSVAPGTARAGEIITVTASANSGYTLDKITAERNDVIFFEDGELVKMIMPDATEVIGAVFTSNNNTGSGTGNGSNSGGSSGSGSSSSSTSDKTETSKPVETLYAPSAVVTKAASTGDSANMLPYVICMMAAGAAIVFVMKKKRELEK